MLENLDNWNWNIGNKDYYNLIVIIIIIYLGIVKCMVFHTAYLK